MRLTSSMVSAHAGHPALNTSIFRFAVMMKSPFKESKKLFDEEPGTQVRHPTSLRRRGQAFQTDAATSTASPQYVVVLESKANFPASRELFHPSRTPMAAPPCEAKAVTICSMDGAPSNRTPPLWYRRQDAPAPLAEFSATSFPSTRTVGDP